MASVFPDENRDRWVDFDTVDLQWIALQSSYAPGTGHTFVTDLSNELSVVGYARDTPVGAATRTVNTSSHQVEYDCDLPSFGTLTAGQTIGSVALAYDTGSDATSRVLRIFDVTNTATSGVAVVFTFSTAHVTVLS